MDKSVDLSKHGINRSRERLGINKKAVEKNARKALEFGVTHGETKGRLRRYMDKLYFNNPKASNMRIYHHYVYIFGGNKLVTVFNLPKELCHYADKLQKEKEMNAQ